MKQRVNVLRALSPLGGVHLIARVVFSP